LLRALSNLVLNVSRDKSTKLVVYTGSWREIFSQFGLKGTDL